MTMVVTTADADRIGRTHRRSRHVKLGRRTAVAVVCAVAMLAAAGLTACGSPGKPAATSSASPSPSRRTASHRPNRLAEGTVTALSGSSITVSTKTGKTLTFPVRDDVRVRLDGKKAHLADLRPADMVILLGRRPKHPSPTASPSDTGLDQTATVEEIEATTPASATARPSPTSS